MKLYVLITILAVGLFQVQGTQGAAVNYDATAGNSTINLGTALRMYYTAFQRIMPCGYPPLNIPVLAPFTMDFYPFDFSNGYYSFVGNISNLMVTGLNDFHVLAGTFNTTTNRTSFDLIFPQVQFLGEFEVNALTYVAGYPIKTVGNGLLNVNIIDYRMVGEFSLLPSGNNSTGLRVSDFNLHFYVGNIINNNWNTLWDISFNNFANKFSSDVTLMWIQQIQVKVDEVYSQLLLPNINGRLNDVTMANLIDFFVSQSMQFNMADCTLT